MMALFFDRPRSATVTAIEPTDCLAALQKDPRARFATADAMASRIAAVDR
jgi:CRP-like cAMP-binding protein